MNDRVLTNSLYEALIGLLAFGAVILAILDLSYGLTPLQSCLDDAIWVLFVIDYATRFFLAKKKTAFIKSNVLDLLAILPISSFFRGLRIVKLVRILRFAIYGARLLHKSRRFFNTNGFKYMAFTSVLLLVIGAIIIHHVEGLSYENAFWWAFVTVTTVGYGDISPTTGIGRVTASILMLVGIGLLGSFTSTITTCFLKPAPKNLQDGVVGQIKDNLDRLDTLPAAEIDAMCVLIRTLWEQSQTQQQDKRAR